MVAESGKFQRPRRGRARSDDSGIVVKAVIQSPEAQAERTAGLLEVTVSERHGADHFVVSTPIAASADDVYSLVDWAGERNKFRQTGDEVIALDDEEHRFRLVIRYMPELRFDYEVEEASRPRLYAYTCVIRPRTGHLERSREEYRIEPVNDHECILTFTVSAHFESDLDDSQRAEVIRNMTIACHNGIAKLKAGAEHGVGTMEAFNATKLMPL